MCICTTCQNVKTNILLGHKKGSLDLLGILSDKKERNKKQIEI